MSSSRKMLAPVSARWRRIVAIVFVTALSTAVFYNYHHRILSRLKTHNSTLQSDTEIHEPLAAPTPSETVAPSEAVEATEEPKPTVPPKPVYKNDTDRPLYSRPFIAVKEKFPIAAAAKSSADLPPIPAWNNPPLTHVPEKTPLFIGFTRNWPLLQQTVVSFLTAGWPREDIYVVENTGVMDANQKAHLGEQNPFYLDYHRLRDIFGVNVLTTSSLQTFAQLQNYFLYEAIKNNWPQYFWAHMDILVQSAEDVEPYKSFYLKSVDALRQTVRGKGAKEKRWALRYFAYDWVTLMNTAAMVELGGWDTMVSYYTADCDMYERMRMANMSTGTADSGPVYDTGESFEDLAILYRQDDNRGSETWTDIQQAGRNMAKVKNNGEGPRNRWQWQQMGGQGEPYYRDMDGFAEALELQVDAGIAVFHAKWGGAGCSLIRDGLKLEDQWLVTEPKG